MLHFEYIANVATAVLIGTVLAEAVMWLGWRVWSEWRGDSGCGCK